MQPRSYRNNPDLKQAKEQNAEEQKPKRKARSVKM
jgi:hypothetical protein